MIEARAEVRDHARIGCVGQRQHGGFNDLCVGMHKALEQRIDARAHRVVEMRYFGGLEIEEIATFLELSPATVKRDWTKARAFLLHSISENA